MDNLIFRSSLAEFHKGFPICAAAEGKWRSCRASYGVSPRTQRILRATRRLGLCHRDCPRCPESRREVRKLVSQGYETAKRILEVNRDALQRIAAALLEREVLDASEIKLLVEGKDLPAKTPSPGKSDDGVQQVLKPEPGRGIVKGGESPARA